MKPLLSICCTSFNHGKYLKETLDGFLLQKTTFPIEIIVHDDASTDNSAEIIKEYAAKDDRFVTILQTENQYSKKIKPWANFVFPKAQGKYLALCEGDDYWTDSLKLQKQVDFLEENKDFELCFHNSKKYFQEDGNFEINTASSNIKSITTALDLVDYNFIATPTVVLRNNFTLPKWFNHLPVGDWPLFFIQVGEGKIKKLEDVMAVYRIHSKGAWTAMSKFKRLQTDYDTISSLLKNNALPEKAHNKLIIKFNKLKKKRFKERIKRFFGFK